MSTRADPPLDHGGIFRSVFRPAWWLRNPHLQTCWPTIARRGWRVPVFRERVELPDGDFLDLAWTEPPREHEDRPIAVLLHGLEGSLDSPYARGMLQAVHARGWIGVLLHFRGCSGVPNRLPRGYHSGETDDSGWLFRRLASSHPNAPLTAVGFSLGGNVLLKYLGEVGDNTPLRAAAAVCPPLRLGACAERLQKGLSRGYQRHLLRRMKANLKTKMQVVEYDGHLAIGPGDLDGLTTFRHWDDAVTAPLHGFAGVDDYYARCSAMPFLRRISVPTLVLQAVDDPFMGPEVLPEARDLSPWVRNEVSPRGGHVGFISSDRFPTGRYWMEEKLTGYLGRALVW